MYSVVCGPGMWVAWNPACAPCQENTVQPGYEGTAPIVLGLCSPILQEHNVVWILLNLLFYVDEKI